MRLRSMLVARDCQALAKMGHKPILELLAVANSGMSVAAYSARVTPAS